MNYCASIYCVDLVSSVNSVWHDFAYIYGLIRTPNDCLSLTHADAANAWRGNCNLGAGEGSSGGGARRNEERAPSLPPPPPPPNTTDVFFAQFLGSQRNMEQMQRNMEAALRNIADNTRLGDNQGGRKMNQYSSLKDFMDTKPPVFKEAEEPPEADEWINTMEQKFHLLRLTEELKAGYATNQLQGPAGIWWSHHRTTYPEGSPITWNRFTTAFRGNYIPPGVVEMKIGEFMKLSQGPRL